MNSRTLIGLVGIVLAPAVTFGVAPIVNILAHSHENVNKCAVEKHTKFLLHRFAA